MMKHSALFSIFTTLLTVMLLMAYGCADDAITPPGADCPAGEEALVTIPLDIDGQVESTRADMPEGIDRRLTSLWVGVYSVATGRLTGSLSLHDIDERPDPHALREVSVSALSGPSRIVAVANFDFRYAMMPGADAPVPLPEALASAHTWEAYRSISATFDQRGEVNTEAPLNALLMSGSYSLSHSGGGMPEPDVANIYPGTGRLSGAIHLRRLISQVRLNVNADPATVSDFTIESWRVVNLPSSAWLDERADADPETNASDVMQAGAGAWQHSGEMTELTSVGKGYSFDWWQLENKRTGCLSLPASASAAGAFAAREREHKDAAGGNTGLFAALTPDPAAPAAANRATYVVFDVSMEMTTDENGNKLTGVSRRLVEATYTIHLGFCEGESYAARANDFNCRRNTRYTYNVMIRNVGDIIVEAASDELNPAVEGMVSDITDSFYRVDAHYSAVNIHLTQSDIDNFQYFISAPAMGGGYVTINSQRPETVPSQTSGSFRYLSWVELRAAPAQDVLAAYRPRSGPGADGLTYLLPDVRAGRVKPGWYTLFINEYVYEDGGYSGGNELGSTAWRSYVNLPDRRVWLNVSGDISADGASIHYKSKYAVSQASIQTYYNNLSPSGLGVEHVNESLGLNLRNSASGKNRNSGRYNLALYLSGGKSGNLSWKDDSHSWDSFVKTSEPQTINEVSNQGIYRPARTLANPLPMPAIVGRDGYEDAYLSGSLYVYDPDRSASPKYIEAITACLNRNRDLDGDGMISADELRWFVPTTAQYIRIILGRRSLEDPLINFGAISQLPNKTGDKNGFNTSLMFYASDSRQIWMMEGASESDWRQWPSSCAAPWEVRCVRNLGGDNSIINESNVTQPAFILRPGTNIVDLRYYEARSIREEAFHSSRYPMPVHHVNDQRYNRCYRSFEFADSAIALNDPRLALTGTTIEWASYLASANPCRALDYTGKRGWRVPNQKEMTILGILGVQARNHAGTTYQVSCSYSFFDLQGYAPGVNPSDPGGTVSSLFRFPMKVLTGNGITTQAERMNALTVGGSVYGVRCVRDVD